MRPDDIERILGREVYLDIAEAVDRAYIIAAQPQDAQSMKALHELLIMMLAATINPSKDVKAAETCVSILRDAVREAIARSSTNSH